MPNTNCLQGIKCPKCGNEASFRIEASIICTVTDDGSEPTGDHHYWDENSYAHCPVCETEGKLAIFMTALADQPMPPRQYAIGVHNDDGDCYDIVIKQGDRPIATLIATEGEVAPLVEAGNRYGTLRDAAVEIIQDWQELSKVTPEAIARLQAALFGPGGVLEKAGAS